MTIKPITAFCVVNRKNPVLSVFDIYDTDDIETNLNEDIIKITISEMAKGDNRDKKDQKKPKAKKK